MPKRAWYLILGELGLILFLGSSLLLQYFYNVYFQDYVNQLLPILIPILSIAFGATSATVATRLYLSMTRIRVTPERREDESTAKKKPQARKTPKRTAPNPVIPSEGAITTAKSRPPSATAGKPIPLPNLENEEKKAGESSSKPVGPAGRK